MGLLIEFFATFYKDECPLELADMMMEAQSEGSRELERKLKYGPEFIAWLVEQGHA